MAKTKDEQNQKVIVDLTRNIFHPEEEDEAPTPQKILDIAFEKSKIAIRQKFDDFMRELDEVKKWVEEVIKDALPEGVTPVKITPYLYTFGINQDEMADMLQDERRPPVAVEFTADDGYMYGILLHYERDKNGKPTGSNAICCTFKRKNLVSGEMEVKIPHADWIKEG